MIGDGAQSQVCDAAAGQETFVGSVKPATPSKLALAPSGGWIWCSSFVAYQWTLPSCDEAKRKWKLQWECLDSGNIQNLKKKTVDWAYPEETEEYSQFIAHPDIRRSQLVTEHKTQIKRLFSSTYSGRRARSEDLDLELLVESWTNQFRPRRQST